MGKRPCVLAFLLFLLGTFVVVVLGRDETKLPIEYETNVKVSGRVDQIQTSEWGRRLTLTQICIESGKKSYQYKKSKVLVKDSCTESVCKGYQISVKGKLLPFDRATNPGQFDESQYYESLGYLCVIKADNLYVTNPEVPMFTRVLETLRSRGEQVMEKILPKTESGIAIAMVLGNRQKLDPEVKKRYTACGIGHILAISGLHITLIGMLLFRLLQFLHVPLPFASALTILLILIYGELTGFSLSTNRAVLMMAFAMFAKIVGRTYDLPSALSISGILILIQTPRAIEGAGFWLSFGAVIAIFYVMPRVKEIIKENRYNKYKKWMDGVAAGISITLVTTPVLLYFQFEWTVYSILWNLIVIPLSSVLLPSLLAGCVFGSISFTLGKLAVAPGFLILKVYDAISRIAQMLPESVLVWGRPSVIAIILYYSILISILIMKKTLRRKISLVLLTLPLVCYPFPRNYMELTMLEVGQGECLSIILPDRSAYIIDCGSTDKQGVGEYRLVPFLKERGVKKIRGILLTHTDIDHVSGVEELLQSYYGKNRPPVYLPVQVEEMKWKEWEAVAHKYNCDIRQVSQGCELSFGGLRMTCLNPNEKRMAGDVNEDCMVWEMSYGLFTALLMGDVGNVTEQRLLEEGCLNTNGYQLLKVGHHGSKQSSSWEFLKEIKPKYAIISYGKHNLYGHPHKETLKRLAKIGTIIKKTQTNGAISMRMDICSK